MKMIYVSALFLLFSFGCAPLTVDKAVHLSNYDICYKYLNVYSSEETRYVAEKEIYKRGITCAGVAEHMERQFQQSMQLLDMSNRLLSPPPSTDCVSRRDAFGNYYTNCR